MPFRGTASLHIKHKVIMNGVPRKISDGRLVVQKCGNMTDLAFVIAYEIARTLIVMIHHVVSNVVSLG